MGNIKEMQEQAPGEKKKKKKEWGIIKIDNKYLNLACIHKTQDRMETYTRNGKIISH